MTGAPALLAAPSGPAGYRDHVNPPLARLLGALALDVTFTGGSGTTLTDAGGRRYLDFAGAYGALPFGHNDPVIWAAAVAVRDSGEPSFVQPSVPAAAGELAARLVELAPAGLDRVTFANSGAEAVEAAFKLARSATGRLLVLATTMGFHGKTLGALSATGRPDYQADFGAPATGFDWVPYGDLAAMRDRMAAAGDGVAAVVVEPIQGEGGVREAPAGYLAGLRSLCDEFGALLIFDEVQTGLGRTGELFGCTADDVAPDVLTLAKALGGGLVPIGAVLSRSSCTTESFSLRHTSTFAGGTLACRVGVATLDRLTADGLLAGVRARGAQLRAGLEALARRYPQVVTDVRGRGLLLGLELSDSLDLAGDQGLVAALADGGNLPLAVTSYLLQVEGIRVAPTLFGHRVLRVEPALTVDAEECDRLLAALDRALALVAAGDTARLLGHLVGVPVAEVPGPPNRPLDRARRPGRPQRGAARFGFVVHPTDDAGLADFDTSLWTLPADRRSALMQRFQAAASALNPLTLTVGSGTVLSAEGVEVFGELIAVPYTAAHLLALPGPRAVAAIQAAVDLSVERGAQLVGLGAYTSIVTRNAVRLRSSPVPVTTGNAFTSAAALRAVRRAADERGVDLAGSTVAVVGAGGSIGRALSTALAGAVDRLILVGRPGTTTRRLQQTADQVRAALAAHPGRRTAVELTDDARAAARRAGVVLTASSSPEALLGADDLAPGAIVCDVSQPTNITPGVVAARPDVAVFAGGLIEIPAGSDFDMRYGLPPGVTFACLAETILLSFVQATEPDRLAGLLSVGETLAPRALDELGELADRHGVRLADLRTTPPAPAAPVTGTTAVLAPRVELHAFGTRSLHPVGGSGR